jgi:pyruvate ferredoxin oxidoreductase alpha subunit
VITGSLKVKRQATDHAIRQRVLTGAEAVAHAMRQIDPDVVPVYPITPQTPIIQAFAQFVADGRATTEIINVESEHSAMSAAVASALAGARTMTATASQGLALMVEVIYIASSLRAPIVMAVGNRALSGPINIHCDHSDSMLARDSGAVQIFVENAQEAYDLMVMALRLAEHPDVRLPVLVCLDGFTVTHLAEPVALLGDGVVREFVGSCESSLPLLDVGRPVTWGPFAMPDYYFEAKRQQIAAMDAVLDVWENISDDFAARSGRRYDLLESYRLEDAERAIVLLGSTAGTAKDVVDALRSEGEPVGLLKIRSFRPLPVAALRRALSNVAAAAVLDRAVSPGGPAPLHSDLAAALHGVELTLRSYVYGLGGRNLELSHLRRVFDELKNFAQPAGIRYLGLRE